MRRCTLFITFFFFTIMAAGQAGPFKYPAIAPSDDTITRFGLQFNDPYTALENVESDSTSAWLAAQNKLLDQYRRSVFAKYTVCERMLNQSGIDWNPRKGLHLNDEIYFSIRLDAIKTPMVYFSRSYKDPYQKMCSMADFLYGSGDRIFIRGLNLSNNKSLLAITFSHGGSDWRHVRIWDIENQKFLDDKIDWVKFNSVTWAKDGVFYSCFDQPANEHDMNLPDKNQRLMFHRLGTAAETDKVILSAAEQNFGFITFYHLPDTHIIIVNYTRPEKDKTVRIVAYLNYGQSDSLVKEFIMAPDEGTNPFEVTAIKNGQFLVKSTFHAPNGKVMLYNPDGLNSGQMLIEQFSQPLRSVNILKNRIFCVYFDMGRFVPVVFDSLGHVLKKMEIPDGFAVSGFTKLLNDSTTFYTLSSFEGHPRTVKFDFKNLNTIVYDDNIGVLFSSKYTTQLVFYNSKDSTRIPMYLVHSKTLTPDASTPLLMYAYGGFGISTDPHFDAGFNLFMSMGGVVAIPLIRGGGELGEKWHKGGMRLNKQKSFDDFIAAAEYLIANKYTSAEKIAIHGGSNGGLLVAAAMIQRPELFKVVVPQAAVLDMISYAKYNAATQAGINEYGNPDDSLEYINLYKLSPMHHLNRNVQYPATLLMAAWNDNRVPPSHTFRFLAGLQNNNKNKANQYLLYLEEAEGHLNEGSFDDFQRDALMYAFIFDNLGVDVNKVH